MNLKQIPYVLGLPFFKLGDGIILSLAVNMGHGAYHDFSQGRFVMGTIGSLLGYGIGKFGLLTFSSSYQLSKDIVTISRNEQDYPLESNERVEIHDRQGLEELLFITATKRSEEWGTVFKSHCEEETSVITDILSPNEAQTRGYVGGETFMSVRFNVRKLEADGYNGIHHYHPQSLIQGMGTADFTLSATDRVCQNLNTIQLLSFNTSYGPELIAYNRRYVYLPQNDKKTEFQRASPRDILHYLSEKGGK